VQRGGLIPAHDRADSDYQQNILVDSVAINGTTYNLYMVHLDGTQLTGNATLEAIFDPGGADEYHSIDYYAPDVLGTRTLLDMGEHIPTPQSSGGENDTLGALLGDRFQGHWHNFEATYDYAVNVIGTSGFGVQGALGTTGQVKTPVNDGTNGFPRTGSTTRPKELTEGASYIIVMTDA
jgi:hypothetical protein